MQERNVKIVNIPLKSERLATLDGRTLEQNPRPQGHHINTHCPERAKRENFEIMVCTNINCNVEHIWCQHE